MKNIWWLVRTVFNLAIIISLVPASMGAQNKQPKKIIYETDMCVAADDVGALAMIHGLQNRGEAELLAESLNATGDPDGVAAIDAINTWYRRGNIPVGIWKGPYPDPDLVTSKVKELVLMGAHQNDVIHFNWHNTSEAAQNVIENWPGNLVTTHVGGDIITGETLTGRTPIDNPVRRAYELEWGVGPNKGRSSWDQVTTLYAIYGTKYFSEEWDGGGNLKKVYAWSFSKDHRGYAAPLSNAAIKGEIERLMTIAP